MSRFALAILGLACLGLACSTISGSIKDRLDPPHEVKGGILFSYEAPSAKMVTLAGNFNNWGGTEGGGRYDPTIDPMADPDGDGIWTIVVPLPPGRYQYKFVIDNGVRWEEDPSNPNTGTEGGIENSLIIIPENVSYKYETVTGTVLSGQLKRETGKTSPSTETTTEKKKITFKLNDPSAGTVNVAGEFNDWSPTATPMKKGENGVWQVTLELAPGKYLYKFVVDGATWKEDPENPDKVADPYGGFNSVLTVE
jgi:1,4-alpha-glucan branching enzyme